VKKIYIYIIAYFIHVISLLIQLTQKEIDWLLETWQPEPLVPELSTAEKFIIDNCPLIEGFTPEGDALFVRGVSEPVIDCSSFDFLGMSQDATIKKVTKDALDYYGCGSCGPRGFYGTIDQHLNFELAIAKVRKRIFPHS